MERDDLDALFGQVRHIGKVFGIVYKDVTGEDFDLEGAITHYPLLAIGIGAGAGILAGYWWGHRSRPQLPPPAAERAALPGETGTSRSYLDAVLPQAMDRVREVLPEIIVSDVVKAKARTWMDNIVDAQVRQNVDSLADTLDARIASFFRGALQRLDSDEDIHLDDPDSSGETPA